MTILNIHLERELAIVTTNTQIQLAGGAMGAAAKLFTLPAVNCVMSGRGDVGVMLNVYAQLFSTMQDFDRLADVLGVITQTTLSNLQHAARQQGAPVPLPTEIALVGMSAAQDEMACRYVMCDGTGKLEIRDVRGGMIAPSALPWPGPMPQPIDLAGAVDLAKQQAELAEISHPGKCWLGDLMTAEITRDTINLRLVRNFWKTSQEAPR